MSLAERLREYDNPIGVLFGYPPVVHKDFDPPHKVEHHQDALPAAGTKIKKPIGHRLAAIDRSLKQRLHVAADAALKRALERAGARIVSRAKGDKLAQQVIKTVHVRKVASVLGPTLVASLVGAADLLDNAFDDFGQDFDDWTSQAWEDVLYELDDEFGVDDNQAGPINSRAADARKEARAWLLAALTSLAASRLYHPIDSAEQLGEVSMVSVPFGMIREAVARAGGAAQMDTPLSGLSDGPNITSFLSTIGVEATGPYEWIYGAGDRMHPFPSHEDLDGVQFASWFDDVLTIQPGDEWLDADYYFPGDHDGCFPAGTVVSGPTPRGATLRRYDGQLVELTFASGQFLSATPNHPILTTHGWVAAGELDESSDVVRCEFRNGIANLIPDNQQVPSEIQNVVRSLGEHAGMVSRCVPVATKNFHGDGVGSEIAIVWTDSQLRDDAVNAPTMKRAFQPDLDRANPNAVLLARDGSLMPGSFTIRASTLGVRSEIRKPFAALGRSAAHAQQLSLGSIAAIHSRFFKDAPDNIAIDTELLSDSQFREAGLVRNDHSTRVMDLPRRLIWPDAALLQRAIQGIRADPDALQDLFNRDTVEIHLDRVISTRQRHFVGHVFNLDTGVGWYVANGIVAHNCLCDSLSSFDQVSEPDTGLAGGRNE